jgi:hypothetical protein
MVGRNRLVLTVCLVFAATCVAGSGLSSEARHSGLASLTFQLPAEPADHDKYSPVAPVPSLLYAVRLNLKVADEWLGDGDIDSAADSVDRVKILLSLCEFRGEEPWRHRIGLLRSRCDDFIALASKKDVAACRELARVLMASALSLDEELPKVDEVAPSDFRPPAPLRNIMKLLDASYTDAKLAKSLDELAPIVYTIAEGTNVARFLRDDPSWREHAGQAREAAIKVAMLKSDTDLKVARQELKNVYERCQACHKTFRR